jgi:CheY-like chemotaxis protein
VTQVAANDKLLSGRRVLVVEDEMLVLMTIESMLGQLGCDSVTSAATSAQAIQLTKSQSFDVAMLDLNLNGRPSYAVADALDALGVPFVFSTGCSSDGMRDDYRDRPTLRKPYGSNQMISIFRNLITN